MSNQALTALTALATAGSTLAAIAALIFSMVSFRRQQLRADAQQLRAERLSIDSVKPLLWIATQSYVDMKSIQIRNHGLGPAIIESASFEKNGKSTSHLVELFANLGAASWITYVDLPPKLVIPAGSHLLLVKQSLEHLLNQGMNDADAIKLLEQIQNQKKGIKVFIIYFDIFGNKMAPVDFTLGA